MLYPKTAIIKPNTRPSGVIGLNSFPDLITRMAVHQSARPHEMYIDDFSIGIHYDICKRIRATIKIAQFVT